MISTTKKIFAVFIKVLFCLIRPIINSTVYNIPIKTNHKYRKKYDLSIDVLICALIFKITLFLLTG
jgi:hypothetical protein